MNKFYATNITTILTLIRLPCEDGVVVDRRTVLPLPHGVDPGHMGQPGASPITLIKFTLAEIKSTCVYMIIRSDNTFDKY